MKKATIRRALSLQLSASSIRPKPEQSAEAKPSNAGWTDLTQLVILTTSPAEGRSMRSADIAGLMPVESAAD